MRDQKPLTWAKACTIVSLASVALLAAKAPVFGVEPAFVRTNITANVLTNESSESWTQEGFAEGMFFDETSYYAAIADCEASSPAYSSEAPPDCWYSPYASCIWIDNWHAERIDKELTFDVDLRGLTTSQYARVTQEFRATQFWDGRAVYDYSRELPLDTLTRTTTALLSTPWFQWGPFGSTCYYDMEPPVIWGEMQQTDIHPNASKKADIAEPVNAISGAVCVDEPEFAIACPGLSLVFRQSYNSQSDFQGSMGHRWVHNYEMFLADSNTVFHGTANAWRILWSGDGDSYWFRNQGSNVFESPFGVDFQLTLSNGCYRVRQAGGRTLSFDTNGCFTALSDAWMNTVSFTYTNVDGRSLLYRAEHGNGQHFDFQYQSGLLARVSSPTTNLALTFSYNDKQELTNVVLSCSSGQYSTRYAYASSTNGSEHCLTQRVDAAGQVLTWNYASNPATGALTSKAMENYASSNLAKASFNYSSNANFTTVTYERNGTNQTYEYWFHPVMKILSEVCGPNTTATNELATRRGVRTTHDYYGNCTNITIYDNEIGEWSERSQQYDDQHHLTNTAFGFMSPPAQAISLAWNAEWGAPASIADAEGHRTEWDYTNGAVCATRSFPATNVTAETRFAYTTNGLLSAVTNANGHWVAFKYDGYGNPTSSVPQAGPTNWMTWDALGHLRQLRLPSHENTTNDPPAMVPRVVAFDPDELGRVRSITWPDGTTDRFFFNAIGNITNHVDVAGRTNVYAWLPTRKLASATRHLIAGGSNQAASISMAYDQQMNMVNVKDELGRTVESYALDLRDRPVTVSNVESQQMTIAWGLADFVSQIIRFDGTTNTFAYDSGGRLSQAGYTDGAVSYGWLRNGLLATASNGVGVVSNAYDGANRLVSSRAVCGPLTNTVSYGLDAVGNATNVALAGTGYQVARSFDAAERLSALGSANAGATLSYDSANGLLASLALSNGVTGAFACDNMDRLTSVTWKDPSNNVLRSRAYGYTTAGMIGSVASEDGDRTEYAYDSLDRLAGETRKDSYGQVLSCEAYQFDLAGNRTRKTILDASSNVLMTVNYAMGAGNRLASWSVAETSLCGQVDVVGTSSEAIRTDDRWGYLWVSNGFGGKVKPEVDGTNFWTYGLTVGLGTQKVYAAIRDDAGNTTYVTNTIRLTVVTNGTYQYSAAGCLTNIAYKGKDYSQTIGLSWNGQYQLTAVATNGGTAEGYGYDALGRRAWTASGGTTNWHVYDGAHVIADLDASGGMIRSYLWGPGVDNLLAMTVYGSTTNTYHAIKDHLNSVLGLVNSSGQIVEQYRYDAWGRTTVADGNGAPLTASAIGNRYCWQGREHSWKTGLYCFRARWYEPITGRWLSNDPIGISGGLNQYVFCANNPVNFVDPFGLVAWGQAGSATLGILGNTFGLALGVGLGLVPEPTMATKVAAVAVVGKSSYGFGANVNNLVAAFRDQAPPSHGALANDIAELVAPGMANAQRVATIADLSTDLVAGRIAGRAAQNALGRLYPYDIERVSYPNPDDLGPLATGLLVFDLLKINHDTYSDLYRGKDGCK